MDMKSAVGAWLCSRSSREVVKRKMHGIYEAASNGEMNINPYGWTEGGQVNSIPCTDQQLRSMQHNRKMKTGGDEERMAATATYMKLKWQGLQKKVVFVTVITDLTPAIAHEMGSVYS
ncbi:hypothetical protein MKW98_016426 [Papaver atlanticum]|uniref:DCD domain-containing protein n=1 Tax=Papaver atlanticum TaxID=357466 RepID=A0AAD4T9D3_9MAGN|nr:hypothetical protein MKW98_016426 [Papaver atlanticum]